jgi:YbbR domain-containing protein
LLDPVSSNNTVQVNLQIEGAALRLDTLTDQLRKTIALSPGMDSIPQQSGTYTIDLREALKNTEFFKQSGVTIISVQPSAVQVAIDEMTTLTLPVHVDIPADELDGQAQATPAQVAVHLPTADASKVSDETAVIARLDNQSLSSFDPGRRVTIRSVRLEPGPDLADSSPLSIDPPVVDVSLTIRSKLDSITLPTVPVDLRLPPDELKRWIVEIPVEEQSLQNVTVTGPSNLIEEIKSGQLVIRAFVRLSFEDLEAQITSKRAVFSDLPSPLAFDADDLDVQLHISRRDETKTQSEPTP